MTRFSIFLGLLVLLLIATVSMAHPESDAPKLNPIVVRAWHEPEVVPPGTQWHGFLQLVAGHNITAAQYQVCNVSDGACFAPLTAANFLDDNTLKFDTNDYLANGKPVNWKAGWRVGIHWHLSDGTENGTWIPRAPPTVSERIPLEDLYLTFDIPAEPRGTPGPGAAMVVALLVASAWIRRR